MDHPTLHDYLTTHPLLDGQGAGTHGYIHFRHLFWEHLVNRARAVAEDLTPLRIFEVGARLQGHLDDEPMTHTEFEAVQQLATALAAGDGYWQRTVLEHLGLDLDPDETITPFHRSVLIHVFRTGRSPVKELWYHPERDVVAELTARGYIDASGRELSLTDEGLAAAGVLWPRCVRVDPGTTFASGSDAYGVILGAFDEEGAQTVVRLLEVQA
ncbi:hypothetical protein RF644_17810 [Kocuria sp. CPCC 205258]|uniref:hypothetical protein n=1 Tax=Kocuria sp. CPCC 205258 TaxID=3073552 RepID=UPI0034D58A86